MASALRFPPALATAAAPPPPRRAISSASSCNRASFLLFRSSLATSFSSASCCCSCLEDCFLAAKRESISSRPVDGAFRFCSLGFCLAFLEDDEVDVGDLSLLFDLSFDLLMFRLLRFG